MRTAKSPNVQVVQSGSRWIVRIVENDATSEHDFTILKNAYSFAAGQRQRLNLRPENATEG